MRLIITIGLLFSVITAKSQIVSPGILSVNCLTQPFRNDSNMHSSPGSPRWIFSVHSGIAANYSFVRGMESSVIATPMTLRLNLMLNRNFYIYASGTVMPAYTNLNPSLTSSEVMDNLKYNSSKFSDFRIYVSTSLSVMYINNVKTFWILGGISKEKSGYLISPHSTPSSVSKPYL